MWAKQPLNPEVLLNIYNSFERSTFTASFNVTYSSAHKTSIGLQKVYGFSGTILTQQRTKEIGRPSDQSEVWEDETLIFVEDEDVQS